MNHRIALLSLLLASSTSFAIVPASKQQILCSSTHVATAKVVSAKKASIECGAGDIGCAPERIPGLADLSIKVIDVLAVKDNVSSFPQDVGISKGSIVEVRIRAYSRGTPAPTASVIEGMFVGKDFLFSVLVVYGDAHTKDGQIRKNYLSPPPYSAVTWPNEDLGWVKNVLSKSDGQTCPK